VTIEKERKNAMFPANLLVEIGATCIFPFVEAVASAYLERLQRTNPGS